MQFPRRLLTFVHARAFSTAKEVVASQLNSCGVITLNRPSTLNAFNLPMINSIDRSLSQYNDDPKVTHVILEGAGGKAFCSGGDVVGVVKSINAGEALYRTFFRQEYHLECFTGDFSKPSIALADGIVMGGGVGLSIHSRFRVATEKTKFAMPEAGIGFFTDAGGGFFLPRLKPDGLGLYIALTGKILQGSDNFWSGFATHFIPHKKISELRDVLTGLRFSSDDNVASVIQKVMDSYHEKSALAPPSLEPFMPLIAKLYGEAGVGVSGTMEQLIDMIKAALAAESRGTPTARWLEEQLKRFEQSSPTSLKVILQQQQLGRKLSLVDVFKMEYRLSQRFSRGNDFPEGVRAALIDKDKSPKWKPSTLAEVTEATLKSLFEPLPAEEEWSP
ncbi:hypothetical protein AAHC03_0776 [Spirometra sp. Aus1]